MAVWNETEIVSEPFGFAQTTEKTLQTTGSRRAVRLWSDLSRRKRQGSDAGQIALPDGETSTRYALFLATTGLVFCAVLATVMFLQV